MLSEALKSLLINGCHCDYTVNQNDYVSFMSMMLIVCCYISIVEYITYLQIIIRTNYLLDLFMTIASMKILIHDANNIN